MLQYFVSVFFAAVGIVTIFAIVDSCKKASKIFRSLMREREILDQTWPDDANGLSPRSSRQLPRLHMPRQILAGAASLAPQVRGLHRAGRKRAE
jgi:hypothetical protein